MSLNRFDETKELKKVGDLEEELKKEVGLRKANEKEEIQRLEEAKLCRRCRKPRIMCKCGRGGGGGGGGSSETVEESADSEVTNDDLLANFSANDHSPQLRPVFTELLEDSVFTDDEDLDTDDQLVHQLQPEEEAIEALLEKLAGLLTIKDDAECGTLTIFSVRPFSSPDAGPQRAYIKLIQDKFDAFKTKLAAEGIGANVLKGYTFTLNPNNLIIRIPSMEHYDRFIKELKKQHLYEVGAKATSENTANVTESEELTSVGFTPFQTQPVLRPTNIIRDKDK